MAISITNIGTSAGGTTATNTIAGVTVPAGALIFIAVTENYGGGTATSLNAPTDGTNTYTGLTYKNQNGNTAVGASQAFYVANASALSAAPITYTKRNSNNTAALSAFYATGILAASPLDSAVSASATGSSSAPSVTSGTPAVPGDLFVAYVSAANSSGTTPTFTQDTGHGWAAPPNSAATNNIFATLAAGGTQVNAGTGTLTFAPTITNTTWAAFIYAFKPAAPVSSGRRINQAVNRAAFY